MMTNKLSSIVEKPKTRTAVRAMIMGLATLLSGPILGINAAVVRPFIDKSLGEIVGTVVTLVVVVIVFVYVAMAFVVGLRTLMKGERSWAVWLGFIPATLAVAFWLFMLVVEIFFPH